MMSSLLPGSRVPSKTIAGRLRLRPLLVMGVAILFATPPCFAVSKEMVQLQTQIQQLQDAVARLQQTSDERAGVLRDLVQQTADSVNKMSTATAQLQGQVRAAGEGQGGKLDQVSGQVQALNDSLDELKARLQRIEKSVAEVQGAQQSMGARLTNDGGPGAVVAPAAGGARPAATEAAPAPATPGRKGARSAPPPGFPVDAVPADNSNAGGLGAGAGGAGSATGAATGSGSAPPVTDLYQTAYGDYNGAKYELATAEFQDVIRFYPESKLAGNAYFYLGEMLYRQREYGPATKQYDKVIEQFPGNAKIPAAQLRKGQSLLAIKQNEAGVRELRSLIGRYPNSPEAVQARSRLSELGLGSRETPRTSR